MTRITLARRRRRKSSTPYFQKEGIAARIFEILGSIAIGVATVIVGIQANRISNLSASVEKRSTELAEQANAISKQSLDLSQQAIDRMRDANEVSAQSLTISKQALTSMQGANDIAANSLRQAQTANDIAQKEVQLSQSQLELTKRTAEPLLNVVPEVFVGYTKLTVSASNSALTDLSLSEFCYKTLFWFDANETVSRSYPYQSFWITYKIDRTSGVGNLASVTIQNKLQSDSDADNKKIDTAMVAQIKGLRFRSISDFVTIKLSYKTSLGDKVEAFYCLNENRVVNMTRALLPPKVQNGFDDILVMVKFPNLSEVANEIIKDLQTKN